MDNYIAGQVLFLACLPCIYCRTRTR